MTTASQDIIDRILHRLDSGEELISCGLKHNGKFCVMGLFLDEYGYDWETSDQTGNHNQAYLILDYDVSRDLNFRVSSGFGAFDYNDLPLDLQTRILNLVPNYDQKILHGTRISLMEISDLMNYRKDFDVATINALLADIIKSGVMFNPD